MMENQNQLKIDSIHSEQSKPQQNFVDKIQNDSSQATSTNLTSSQEGAMFNNLGKQETNLNLNQQNSPYPPTTNTDLQSSTNIPEVQNNVPININNQPPQQQQQQQQHQPIQPLLAPDSPEHNLPDNGQITTIINVPNQPNINKLTEQTSPQKTMITKVKLSDELNIFDWFRTTDIINQIAEKAKHSVDTVITALDPGMKEYLYSGGNINIMVIGDSDNFVSPIRDSFQSAFGRATVFSAKLNPSNTSDIDYPIKLACGFNEAIAIAKERINRLRLDTNAVPQNQVILAVQPSLVNLQSQNGLNDVENAFGSQNWFFTYCMLIEDPVLNIIVSSYSQFVPIDSEVLTLAKEAKFPDDFQNNQLGFALSIDDIMNSKLRLEPQGADAEPGADCRWLLEWSGLSETQVIRELSLSLAYLYRRKWNECVN